MLPRDQLKQRFAWQLGIAESQMDFQAVVNHVERLENAHQPYEAPQNEGEHIADLDAKLPGRGHYDGISALSPAQVGLLGLQVMNDGSQIG